VSAIALNANGDPDRFAAFALPIVADATGDFEGPLAGILAGLAWARAAPSSPVAIVTAAVDTPFFPADLAARLAVAAAGGAGIAIARSRGRLHPVFGCFPTACADDLARFLEEDAGSLRVHDWLARVGFAPVDFSGGDGAADPFFNINTPADLAAAEAALAAGKP
jgi:molybdopterin-guanine dinucleotide biosynthesis protein A